MKRIVLGLRKVFSSRMIVLGIGGLSLCACMLNDRDGQTTRAPDALDVARNIDLQPRFPRQSQDDGVHGKQPKSFSFWGREEVQSAAVVPAKDGAKSSPDGDGYDLNFENAPVATVAKVILGDILGAGYVIDPRIQGTVTLASAKPISKKDLVFALENALRTNNVIVVPDRSGYRLIPSSDGAGAAGISGADQPGFGISVVPLRYVSAPTILKLLESLAIKPNMARVDSGRNLVVVQGTGPERRSAIETIQSFDVDWMQSQSVGIYTLQNASPEAMISDLEKVMETGEGGMNQTLMKLQPIARLNAVLVATRKPHLLKAAAKAISRLDLANSSSEVQVYRVRYGDARQMASILNDLFSTKNNNNGTSRDGSMSPLAPGSGTQTLTTDLQNTSSGFDPGGRGGGLFASQGGGTGNSSGSALGNPSTGRSSFSSSNASASTLGQAGGGAVSAMMNAGRAGDANGNRNASVNLPGIRVTPDVANNSLLIYASPENFRLVEQTLRKIDRAPLQVAIHATIAEVSLNDGLQYGVQYYLKSQNLGLGTNKGSIGLDSTNSAASALASAAASAAINRVLPGFNLLVGSGSDPSIILDALRNITDVKVLSTPSVVVIDNQIANLQVGDQVPITTQSATNISNPNTPIVSSIDYRNTGVILRVLPRISSNGNVVLDIEQEISNVSDTPTANTLTPTVSQRRVKSSISVASGQSVLLGGLISERQNRNREAVPILGELPVIGEAFSHNRRGLNRTELMVFIQPQIIRDSVDAYKIAEELRAKLRGSDEASFPAGPALRRDPLHIR